ncbi:MAG: GIY-YIG nuclease family protein [Patescibacteria group bacterium]|nr:GIY-YIG nuclease family protein [Patescibacteria group bacterium]
MSYTFHPLRELTVSEKVDYHKFLEYSVVAEMEAWQTTAFSGATPSAVGGLRKMPYTYILKSEVTGKYYVGSCDNLGERLKKHNAGRNKSTKQGIPWKVVYSETFPTKQEAYKREFQIKRYKGGTAFKKLICSN